jgi:hypothetical protein
MTWDDNDFASMRVLHIIFLPYQLKGWYLASKMSAYFSTSFCPGYADAARVGILLIVFKVSSNVSILNLYQRV